MKKLKIYFILCFSFLITTQCSNEDIIEPVYGTQENSTFYKTDAQISEALTGTYLQLRHTWEEYAKNHYFIGDISTDDAWKGGNSEADIPDLENLQQFVVNPTNSIASTRWTILYGVIARANEVIAYAPDAEGDKDLIARYINEAKFLRAFAYYNLVTVFAGVPIVLKPITPEESVEIPRSTSDEVFKQIIIDLTAATELPAKSGYGEENQYRVTRGLAYTMMGKSYMFQNDFQKAEESFAKVIQSGEYSLLPDYGANWRIENSQESVFEINNQMSDDREIALGTNVPHFFTTRITIGYQGYGIHLPTQDLLSEFAPDDPRITYTFTRTGDRFVNDSPDTGDQDNSLSPADLGDRKILVPQYLRGEYYPWILSYNIRMIRYSDVLLLYAEALNENGKSGEALTHLNQVRERARLTPPVDPQRSKQVYFPPTNIDSTLPDITVTNQDELRKAIWHERRVELGMEGWRREDLSRQKRFGEVMRAFADKYNTTKGANFQDNRDYLLPIPQNEIDFSNGTITQNPGF